MQKFKKPKFVDTNIFVRFLTKDDELKAQKCFELFQRADRRAEYLETTEVTITELVHVLASKQLYNLKPSQIAKVLQPIIDIKGLKIESRKVVRHALYLYSTKNIDFEDAMSVARMFQNGVDGIYSYDRDFEKFEGIARYEP